MRNRTFSFFFFFVMQMIVSSAWAFPFSRSCDIKEKTPRPEWVGGDADYSLPGYYVGVGVAEKNDDDSIDKRRKLAESNAKLAMVGQIEVKIRAENTSNQEVTNNDVNQYASSKVIAESEEVLRGLETKHWDDVDNCKLYVLVKVSKDAVVLAKKEKLLNARFEKLEELFSLMLNEDATPQARERMGYWKDANHLFKEIDFKLIDKELEQKKYAEKMAIAFAILNKEIGETEGRTAVYVQKINEDISPAISRRIVDQLHAADNKADFFSADCDTAEDCILKAKKRGFATLAWLSVDTRVEESSMGALRGTLSVSKTTYNVANSQIMEGPAKDSAQVMAWGHDELDWFSAADKVMQNLK